MKCGCRSTAVHVQQCSSTWYLLDDGQTARQTDRQTDSAMPIACKARAFGMMLCSLKRNSLSQSIQFDTIASTESSITPWQAQNVNIAVCISGRCFRRHRQFTFRFVLSLIWWLNLNVLKPFLQYDKNLDDLDSGEARTHCHASGGLKQRSSPSATSACFDLSSSVANS